MKAKSYLDLIVRIHRETATLEALHPAWEATIETRLRLWDKEGSFDMTATERYVFLLAYTLCRFRAHGREGSYGLGDVANKSKKEIVSELTQLYKNGMTIRRLDSLGLSDLVGHAIAKQIIQKMEVVAGKELSC